MYESLGAVGCTINGVLLKNWDFLADPGTPTTADEVGVTPDPTRVGFESFIGLNAFGMAVRGLTFSYVAVLPQLNMAELHVSGSFLGAGTAQVTTTVGGTSLTLSAIPAGDAVGVLTFTPPLAGPDILVSNHDGRERQRQERSGRRV